MPMLTKAQTKLLKVIAEDRNIFVASPQAGRVARTLHNRKLVSWDVRKIHGRALTEAGRLALAGSKF